jgi:hypothetical protein
LTGCRGKYIGQVGSPVYAILVNARLIDGARDVHRSPPPDVLREAQPESLPTVVNVPFRQEALQTGLMLRKVLLVSRDICEVPIDHLWAILQAFWIILKVRSFPIEVRS